MIELNKLTPNDIGRWVLYTGSDGKKEKGRIKNWNSTNIFVVYNANGNWDGDHWKDYTAQSTRPNDLKFL